MFRGSMAGVERWDKAARYMVYANMLCIFFGGQFALSPNCATFAAGDALRNLVRGASVTLAARESKGT